MLKGIDRTLNAELLNVLMSMGHGDDIVLCDVNHPAASIASHTVYGKVIHMSGCDLPRATEAILSLMPLDTFVEAPVFRMKVVDDPEKVLPIVTEIGTIADRSEGQKVTIAALDRFAFYAAAKQAYAIVRTSDPGPYGCFILRKGVI
jgi:L-fucose mutarotase